MLASGVPDSKLGQAVRHLYDAWTQLTELLMTRNGYLPPSLEHIKEVAEFSIRQVCNCTCLLILQPFVIINYVQFSQCFLLLTPLKHVSQSGFQNATTEAHVSELLVNGSNLKKVRWIAIRSPQKTLGSSSRCRYILWNTWGVVLALCKVVLPCTELIQYAGVQWNVSTTTVSTLKSFEFFWDVQLAQRSVDWLISLMKPKSKEC